MLKFLLCVQCPCSSHTGHCSSRRSQDSEGGAEGKSVTSEQISGLRTRGQWAACGLKVIVPWCYRELWMQCLGGQGKWAQKSLFSLEAATVLGGFSK